LIPHRHKENNTVSFTPVFSFRAGDGKSYTVVSDFESNHPGYEVGQEVDIRYEKVNPAEARLASFQRLWSILLLFGIIGAFILGGGYTLLRFLRRFNRRSVLED
jgi:hypothetical protein